MERADTPKKSYKENPLISIALNIVVPSFILIKFSGEDRLGPVYGLVIALLFPLGYGIYDFIKSKKVNLFSVVGLLSVPLTGAIGLMELDPLWVALKEAAIPFVFGVATILTLKSKTPLIEKLLINDQVFNLEKINEALTHYDHLGDFNRLLQNANWMLAGSFFLSSALNFGLARYVVVSEAGTPAFNEELGTMQAMSFPVIVVPSMIVMAFALWYLISGMQRLTQLKLEELMKQPEKKQ